MAKMSATDLSWTICHDTVELYGGAGCVGRQGSVADMIAGVLSARACL